MALGMAKFLECCNQVRAQRDTIGACIADKLPHIVAVFLLHEGVVVLVIAAGAGEENLFVRAPIIDLFIEEFGAVVGIEGDGTRYTEGASTERGGIEDSSVISAGEKDLPAIPAGGRPRACEQESREGFRERV